MLRAARKSLTVNHHRTCKREARPLQASHFSEQYRRAAIVGASIVRQVIDIDAEPNLGGEMDDGLDAGQRPRYCSGIAHVANLQLAAFGCRRSIGAMYIGA